MKSLFYVLFLLVLLLSFSGCSSQKVVPSKNYFPKYTKDEILLAGKEVFLAEGEYKYIIDSYRDRLEVTRISVEFAILGHQDYLLSVKEDECGTRVSLKFTSSTGVDKKPNHRSSKLDKDIFWENIQSFLDKKQSLKDMSECYIKNEFEVGIRKENIEEFEIGDYNATN